MVLCRDALSKLDAAFVLCEHTQEDERGREAPTCIQRCALLPPTVSQSLNVGFDVECGKSGLQRKRGPDFRARQKF